MFRDNLEIIRARIEAACRRAGRDPREVTLIAVSKFKPASDVLEAIAAGQECFGENRVQEMRQKQAEVEEQAPGRAVWHFIGNLQKNKVRQLIGHTALIHSISSLELAQEAERQAVRLGVEAVLVLIEVNVAGEATKQGAAADEAAGLVRSVMKLAHIRVRGLMAVAPPVEDPEENRMYFRSLRGLRDALQGEFATSPDEALRAKAAGFTELSMGMSGDFEVAIEEGATFVRIGTALFGPRQTV